MLRATISEWQWWCVCKLPLQFNRTCVCLPYLPRYQCHWVSSCLIRAPVSHFCELKLTDSWKGQYYLPVVTSSTFLSDESVSVIIWLFRSVLGEVAISNIHRVLLSRIQPRKQQYAESSPKAMKLKLCILLCRLAQCIRYNSRAFSTCCQKITRTHPCLSLK